MKYSLVAIILATVVSSILLHRSPAFAADENGELIPRKGFVLTDVRSFRRRGIDRYDPLEALMVREGIEALAPQDGQPLELGDGEEHPWRAVELNESGGVDREVMGRDAYLYVPLQVDSEQVMILHGRSHNGLFVNGIPHTSNLYGYDYYHIPVLLKAGNNGILFRNGRAGIQVRLYPPPAETFILAGDATLPDLLVGQPSDTWAAVILVNATHRVVDNLTLVSRGDELTRTATPVPPLPPLSIRKVGFRIQSTPIAAAADPITCRLEIAAAANESPIHSITLDLRRRRAEDAQKRTFVSNLDGSVQYFALRPAVPLSEHDPAPALVLSCHGASVEAISQANSYSAKSWLHLVAPTNRRPYGFDWEDLGRADALEVLEYAKELLPHDPARIYLTGHSMGGHGTWHLGSLFPDKFAAIGPSAGWISYTSYASRDRGGSAEPTELEKFLNRGRVIGDPRNFLINLQQQGIYILHGGGDDNVPAAQAREMAELLTDTHHDWDYHEEPGQGHWWSNPFDDGGAACMDWPYMYDSFARHALPPSHSVRSVEFATANPGVSSSCHWLHIEAQLKLHEVSDARVMTWPNKRRFEGTTSNVAVLGFDLHHLPNPGPLSIVLDGQELSEVPFPADDRRIWLERDNDRWRIAARPDPSRKSSQRYGSAKNELRNRFVMVYGTGGTDEERRWTYAKARLDSESLWYRGNASVDVIADTGFEPNDFPDRTVILYGNADTNSAWSRLLADSPVQVHSGSIEAGDNEWAGDDLACILLRPRPDSHVASVIAMGATGTRGLRLSCKQTLFQPFVRYPDCIVLRAPEAGHERATIALAGYFGLDWSLEHGEFLWGQAEEE